MIDFLSHWMRGLILIIFIAVILEMVIPNNAMQRYVRLVMGLMIIALMLSPVLQLYHQSQTSADWSIDDLLKSSGQPMENLNQINQDSQKLSQTINGETVQSFQAEVAAQMKAEIEQNHPTVTVEKVDVSCSLDASDQPKDLQAVQITLLKRQDPNQVQPIQPVAPVTIDAGQNTAASSQKPALTEAEQQNVTAIRSEIASEYHLDRSKVNVVWQDF